MNRPSYSTTLAADGGDALYVWSATNLPTGLAINSNTGVISGTPTATGTKTVAVTLNDANGDTPATANLSLTINAAPSITTASLPAGEATVAYSTTMTTTGGTTPFSWSATGLPPGLSINSSTGVISGTPTTAGTFASVVVSLTDAAGATTSHAAYSLTINPQPTISSVVLANGTGTAGTIEKADTVAITFSATMKVSSFCSTWSNDANNQSLNTDNNVTVSVSDGSGATNDVLTVTSTSCTFNLGSIDLGSPSYVSSAATFAGSAGNKSTITWTASTHKLVILLGTKTAGTVANVASSTPVYTASGAIQDPAGAGLGNSPYTLAPAKQF